ncbi:MAG: GNAT family N-acetyltransferase [Candidatus Ornithospirochaeta sp.]
MKEYTIREMKREEYTLLPSFLYDAIYVHKGETPPPYSIIYKPELQVYVEKIGDDEDDHILCAEADGAIVGAVWVRIMDDYGHVDDETPSLIISVKKEYRNRGIGRALMESMILLLSTLGYSRVSLSTQKENYAFNLYLSLGFEIVEDKDDEYIMVKKLG